MEKIDMDYTANLKQMKAKLFRILKAWRIAPLSLNVPGFVHFHPQLVVLKHGV